MKSINPQFIYDESGKKIGAILAIEEFEKCIDVLEDYQDYMLIKKRRAKKEKLIPHEEVVQKMLKKIKK